MKITDPRKLLNQIDLTRIKQMQSSKYDVPSAKSCAPAGPIYVEPAPVEDVQMRPSVTPKEDRQINIEDAIKQAPTAIRRGKIQRLGDFIDTDAVSP
jgi:hypothetical protein